MNPSNSKSILDYRAWLITQNLTTNYANAMTWWLNYVEQKSIGEITLQEINKFFESMRYSRATQNLVISAGRNYYTKFLLVPKKKNEWYDVSIKTVKYEAADTLTDEDIEEIKKYLKTYHTQTYSIPKIEAFIDLLRDTGCGLGEFLALKREHFDLNNNVAHIFGEELKFTEETKKEIKHYFKTEPEITNAFNIADGKFGYIMNLVGKYLKKKITVQLFKKNSIRNIIEICNKYWRN